MEANDRLDSWTRETTRLGRDVADLGLLVEGICLLWARPLAFILLVCGGGLLCAAGIAVYLYSLVSAGEVAPEP